MSSDSEEFASADENSSLDGKESKPRRRSKKSSSNYDSEDGTPSKPFKVIPDEPKKVEAAADGWDDFDVDKTPECDEPSVPNKTTDKQTESHSSDKKNDNVLSKSVAHDDKDDRKQIVNEKNKDIKKQKNDETNEVQMEDERHKDVRKENNDETNDGWDNFDDDWGQESQVPVQKQQPSQSSPSEEQIRSVADRLATLGDKPAPAPGAGWGWGWGVDSILSSATAGISTITSTVSQGLSTVSSALESGIGIPEPEELARRSQSDSSKGEPKVPSPGAEDPGEGAASSGDGTSTFGGLLSGVSHITKFVEDTGTKVIAGGLDTLETIGKKTMEVLQDGDPKLAKKRALLGLDSGDKPILSQILREAKSKADEEDRIREERKEAKEVHYETLFDDFGGLVHLEALEMLSRQASMRIEEKLRAAGYDKRKEMQETMQQVAELCETSDSDDEIDDVTTDKELTPSETLYNRLREATQDSAINLQFTPIVKQYEEVLAWLGSPEADAPRAVYKRGVSALAEAGALAVSLYHKAGELLLCKTRRATADESDSHTQMTSVLTRHINDLARQFTEKLHQLSSEENKDAVNGHITNIFLEANNTVTYIQNALQLTLPILQIGAL